MASEATLREVAERVVRAFREFSESHHWIEGKYHLYLHFDEDWKTVHVIIVVDKFTSGDIKDQSNNLSNFFDEKELEIIEDLNSFNLTLRTSAQVREGGIYEIGPEFVDVEDLLASKPVVQG